MTTEAKLNLAIQGLRDVLDPIGKYRRNLKPGYLLDGAGCADLLRYPSTYQEIAREALEAIGAIEVTS